MIEMNTIKMLRGFNNSVSAKIKGFTATHDPRIAERADRLLDLT